MIRILTISLLALLVTACSKPPTPTNTPAATNANQPVATPSPAPSGQPSRSSTVKADFTNPKTAVDTFVAAVQNQDTEALSKCFDPENPGDYQSFVNKTTDAKELAKLAAHFEGAKVTQVQANGDTAIAKVTFQSGDSEIQIKKTSGGWKIVGF